MTVEAGDVIESPTTGERITFIKASADTNGELLVLEHRFQPGGFVPLTHFHPKQEEQFHVISGAPRFSMKGVEQTAVAGEAVIVPPGTPHLYWNPSDAESVVRIELRPALRSEDMFAVLFELVRAGRCNRKGIPSPLIGALYSRRFRSEVQPSGLWGVANKFSAPGALLARFLGQRLPD